MKNKTVSKAKNEELKNILRSNKQMAKLNNLSLDAISEAITKSGIPIPRQMETTSSQLDSSIVKLSRLDIILLALISNPNKSYLIYSGDKPRQDVGLYQLGRCFTMQRKSENGKINHYVAYTGAPLNAAGKHRMETLRKKMNNLAAAAGSGVVTIQDATPTPKGAKTGIKKETQKATKRTRKISSGKKPAKVSLTHAARFAKTQDEQKFIDFSKMAPRVEHLLSEGVIEPDGWHQFRWKWQTRYGFDMSQVSFRQEKQENGTFNIYGKITPNAVNMLNSGLINLITFLSLKGINNKNNPDVTGAEASIIQFNQ